MNFIPIASDPVPHGIDHHNIVFEETPSKDVRWHAYADIFPSIEGAAFQELLEDIRRNGVLEPIVFPQRGHPRRPQPTSRGPASRGRLSPHVEFEGDNPLAFVLSKNLTRRHLNESQRAMVAARLADMGEGRPSKTSPIGEVSQGKAAELLNVGKRSVERAREVQEHGAPELKEAVERGEVSVSAAADIATLAEPEQREVVAKGKAEIVAIAKASRATRLRKGFSKPRRTEKEKQLERAYRERRESQKLGDAARRAIAILRDRLSGDEFREFAELVQATSFHWFREWLAKGDRESRP